QNPPRFTSRSPACQPVRCCTCRPRELDRILRAVPAGTTIDIATLREQLADANDADATCAATTSMFLRIVAVAAPDEVADGAAWDEVTPFWRAIDPHSPLAGRLSCGR